MVAPSLTDTLADMLLTGAGGLDDDFDGISEVLSVVKDLGVPDPDADFFCLIHAAARESRLTPIDRYATEREPRAQGHQREHHEPPRVSRWLGGVSLDLVA